MEKTRALGGTICYASPEMFQPVDTKRPELIEAETLHIFRDMFPGSDLAQVKRAFEWTVDCFEGRHPGYQAIDARYHDLEHTLQGTLCLMRLLHRYHQNSDTERLSEDLFQLGLLAILFHDTGYLKIEGDNEGTGAKYTLTHVDRSVQFTQDFLTQKDFDSERIQAVQHMIRCTGVNTDLDRISFANALIKTIGFALGTSDLLGQMAAPDYVDKLPILYSEFEESIQFIGARKDAIGNFQSVDDLMSKTPGFYEFYVLPKINNDFLGLYRYLNVPYPDGLNVYLECIEANIQRLKGQGD